MSGQIADQVTLLGLYYNPQPGAFSDRVANMTSEWPGIVITWNVHEWDLTGTRRASYLV